MRRPTAVTIGLAAVGLSACGTDDASTPDTTTTTSTTASTAAQPGSPMTSAMTDCTKTALAEPALQAAQLLGPDNIYTVDDVSCTDGWGVTSGLLSSADNPEMGAPTSFVFKQEGRFWIVQDKATVCGSDPSTTTAPADAAIPADLFLRGCAAG